MYDPYLSCIVSFDIIKSEEGETTLDAKKVDRGGGECGGGCEDKSVCAWEDKILSAFMKVKKRAFTRTSFENVRKGHSVRNWRIKTEQTKPEIHKPCKDGIKAGIIPFKTDQEILDEVVPSDNRQNMSGMGRKLPGGGSTSRRRTHRAYGDVMNRDQMTQILRQQEQEKELYRKQAEEAQQRAYLASLPVKSLARFRCVPKPCCAYIDDDLLGVLHGERAVEETTPIMYDPYLSCIVSFDIIKSEEGETTLDAKKEFHELPPLQRWLDGPYYLVELSRGLGFDVSTNTFKMVCVLSRREFSKSETFDSVSKNLCTMVHVLGMDSSWREIPQIPPYPTSGDGIFAHGCLYWAWVLYVDRMEEQAASGISKPECSGDPRITPRIMEREYGRMTLLRDTSWINGLLATLMDVINNEDGCRCTCPDDDDGLVVSDDAEMAWVALDHTGGDAGGSPPQMARRPSAISMLDKVVVGSNVYTVGERVRLGLELKLRLLWRKNKNRIKADHYTKHDSPDEAKNHPPPPRVWGDKTQDEWNELVDWWSHPNRVSRSFQNAANRAKNTILNLIRENHRAREDDRSDSDSQATEQETEFCTGKKLRRAQARAYLTFVTG
ncbi:hypothetical protein Tco_1514838 [Tanacetum coccineum]